MSRESLIAMGFNAKRAMLIFQDALVQHHEASHLGQDAETLKAQQLAHDALDAYFDHIRALVGGK